VTITWEIPEDCPEGKYSLCPGKLANQPETSPFAQKSRQKTIQKKFVVLYTSFDQMVFERWGKPEKRSN